MCPKLEYLPLAWPLQDIYILVSPLRVGRQLTEWQMVSVKLHSPTRGWEKGGKGRETHKLNIKFLLITLVILIILIIRELMQNIQN